MANANVVLTTQAEVVQFLVANNIKQNLAQASVTENFNFNSDTQLQRYQGDEECNVGQYTVVGHTDDDHPIITITGDQAISWYNDWFAYGITETPEGITFDGDLVYDIHGFYLPQV